MKKKDKIVVRELETADYPVFEEFLYNAIFIPKGAEPPAKEIIFEPEIYVYIKDYGNQDDCGVVAEVDGEIVGAAWARIIPAFGHISDDTPELAISVLHDWRGKGVGGKMMTQLFAELRNRGYNQTSLSVQKDNPAVRFYKRLGYKIMDERLDRANHEDYIMVKSLIGKE